MTLEEGEEPHSPDKARSLSTDQGNNSDPEEIPGDAGMWRRLAGFCKKLYEKVQQTWWRVRQWHACAAATARKRTTENTHRHTYTQPQTIVRAASCIIPLVHRYTETKRKMKQQFFGDHPPPNTSTPPSSPSRISRSRNVAGHQRLSIEDWLFIKEAATAAATAVFITYAIPCVYAEGRNACADELKIQTKM